MSDYPENIGFEEHCVRMLDLARRENKMLHVHTDQRNDPSESGTERLIEAVRREGNLANIDGAPAIWAVHMISPSTYEEPRFDALVEGMLECNIGIICCPSAAIGMRQLRPRLTPTYNSIPRLLELAAAGVQIRLGSDNVADMCSPSTTADLVDEIFILSAALRFYKIEPLAKFAAGVALDATEKEELREHLEKNDAEIARVLRPLDFLFSTKKMLIDTKPLVWQTIYFPLSIRQEIRFAANVLSVLFEPNWIFGNQASKVSPPGKWSCSCRAILRM